MKQGLGSLKTIFFAVAMTLAVSATLNSSGSVPFRQPSTDGVVSGTYLNPLQVALLYWYPANLTTQFAVGSEAMGVAFDGADIWVANFGSNDVTKLQASTGAQLGTFGVGRSPSGVAFDGANIWVANFRDDNVTKLRASTGKVLGTFAVRTNPVGVAFDGANIWVANGGGTVTKLRTSDGAVLGTFAVGGEPFAVAFDGANIWVTNANSNTVSKL
jgi:YVTN family beta-propeller protein